MVDEYIATMSSVTSCPLAIQIATWNEANKIVTLQSTIPSFDPTQKWKAVKQPK